MVGGGQQLRCPAGAGRVEMTEACAETRPGSWAGSISCQAQ